MFGQYRQSLAATKVDCEKRALYDLLTNVGSPWWLFSGSSGLTRHKRGKRSRGRVDIVRAMLRLLRVSSAILQALLTSPMKIGLFYMLWNIYTGDCFRIKKLYVSISHILVCQPWDRISLSLMLWYDALKRQLPSRKFMNSPIHNLEELINGEICRKSAEK